jgi:heavy metal sensor kinase
VVRHHDRGESAFVREEMEELAARSGMLIEIRSADRGGPVLDLSPSSPALAGGHLPDDPGPATINGALYEIAASDLGGLRLRVAMPAMAAERLHRAIDLLVWALLAGGLALAAVVAGVIAARVVAPLASMTDAAERIQAESLSKRLVSPPHTYDEVSRLAASFNSMLARLEIAHGRLQAFTGDAAHELRTPLAGMKAHVQSALAATPEGDAARPMLDTLLVEVNRLAGLVQRLLILSRVDEGSMARDPVDFSDLVVERVEHARAFANRQEVAMDVTIAQPAQRRADAMLLRQAVDNLLDNAIKYTPCGGHVAVTLSNDATVATLRIADTGVGISPAALPHVFDRFFREDRSRARETGGSGLGLAIVACVVAAHGGTVRVESDPGRGTTFELVLPRVSLVALPDPH